MHTNHKKLTFFLETKQLNPKQVRWLKELACYDFAIKYIKNENNVGVTINGKSENPTTLFDTGVTGETFMDKSYV